MHMKLEAIAHSQKKLKQIVELFQSSTNISENKPNKVLFIWKNILISPC